MLLENKHKDNKLATQTSLDGGASTSMAIKNEQNVGLVAGDMNNPDLTINEEQQLMDALNDLIPADMDVLAGIILDDLINEEQAAAVSSVAEALEMDAMAGVAPATAEPEPIPSTSAAAVAAELAGGKAEPNSISDNACDGMDFETTADEFLEVRTVCNGNIVRDIRERSVLWLFWQCLVSFWSSRLFPWIFFAISRIFLEFFESFGNSLCIIKKKNNKNWIKYLFVSDAQQNGCI